MKVWTWKTLTESNEMKRFSSVEGEESKSMQEQSKKIRSAGMEEPEQENKRETKFEDEKPEPTETSEPPKPNAEGAPGEEVSEPPAPTKKSEQEMAQPPEAFLDAEDADTLGANELDEQEVNEGEHTEGAEVNKEVEEEMGADKPLSEVLKATFEEFLKGKPKTMKDQSEAIKKA